MSHTNSTTYYGLPQFITTDKPAWLTDVNVAYQAIDTAVHNAKSAADAAQGDATQALTDAGNADTKATAADSKGSGAVASIAPAFSTTDTYNLHDIVMYNNLAYKCIAAVSTPGEWTGSANWTRVYLDEVIPGVISDLRDVNTAGSSSDDVLVKDAGVWVGKKVSSLVKSVIVTGITDANGNLSLTDFPVDDYIILSCAKYREEGYSGIAYTSLALDITSTYYMIHLTDLNNANLVNSATKVQLWYLEK